MNYKSTTHKERFYHFRTGPYRGTVFMREEPKNTFFQTPDDTYFREAGCYGEVAILAPPVYKNGKLVRKGDVFDKTKGRAVARRRYFLTGGVPCSDYESALGLLRGTCEAVGKVWPNE